jgi:hypothetical protein
MLRVVVVVGVVVLVDARSGGLAGTVAFHVIDRDGEVSRCGFPGKTCRRDADPKRKVAPHPRRRKDESQIHNVP